MASTTAVLSDKSISKGRKEMIDSLSPFDDFHNSARETLQYLHRTFGFALWMVTRTSGDDWIVLQAEDHGYNVQPGDVFKWTDSFCSRMVEGLGPCIAPHSNKVPVYASAPIGQQVPIGAYIGVPINNRDGTLFGTLCAIDPVPQSQDLVNALPKIELLSRMLGTILANEIRAEVEMRRAERAEHQAEIDSLTGLFNRRGWERLLLAEEARCARYGHPAAVVCIDLDGFKQINDTLGHSKGDELLVTASNALLSASREGDIVARLGGDEFAVLTVNVNQTEAYARRLEGVLSSIGIKASVAVSQRHPSKTLKDAFVDADQRMYQRKRERGAELREAVSSIFVDHMISATIPSSAAFPSSLVT